MAWRGTARAPLEVSGSAGRQSSSGGRSKADRPSANAARQTQPLLTVLSALQRTPAAISLAARGPAPPRQWPAA